MGKQTYGIGLFLLTILLLFFLSGCAFLDRYFGDEEKPPDQLMMEALDDSERGRYTAASEKFQLIKDRYPYSQYAVEAELRLADMLYKRKLFREAFDAYHEFERLHPRNPNIPYAIYQKGMCQFSQASTIDRDQSTTREAVREFERLVRKFPSDEYANRARRKLRECYINLAKHELYVANFYFKQENYRASIERYLYLLQNYPDLGQYQEVLEYLKKCKERLAQQEGSS